MKCHGPSFIVLVEVLKLRLTSLYESYKSVFFLSVLLQLFLFLVFVLVDKEINQQHKLYKLEAKVKLRKYCSRTPRRLFVL